MTQRTRDSSGACPWASASKRECRLRLTVGAHHKADVFQRTHDAERPEHPEDAQNIVLGQRQVVSADTSFRV